MTRGQEAPVLEAYNLRRHFQSEVLAVPELALYPGRIYGIMGPSGAGKSTLLRLLSLLDRAPEATIKFRGSLVGENSNHSASVQRAMTLVHQEPLLFRTSVAENIGFGLKARGYSAAEIKRTVRELAVHMGLDTLLERQATTLSSGEAQRVALARAVAFNPELLFLDEPTANLDPANVELIEQMIRELHRSHQMTTVLVTHNVFQARRLAQEVIFLHQGRVVEMGPARQIFESPRDERTAAFIQGKMVY